MVREKVRWLLAASTMALLVASFASCTSEDGVGNRPGDSSGPDVEDPPDCEAGEVRHCSVPVGTQGGVLTCTVGDETCTADGTWGECIGETFQRSAIGEHLPDGLTREQLEDPLLVKHWLRRGRLDRAALVLSQGDLGQSRPGYPLSRAALQGVPPALGRPAGAVDRLLTAPVTCDSPCDPDCMLFPDPTGGDVEPPGVEEPPPPGADPYEAIGAPGTPAGLMNGMFGTTNCATADDCNLDSYCDLLDVGDDLQSGCVPWPAGEYDPLLIGMYDLTVGFGCGGLLGSATTEIPLCNRGAATFNGDAFVRAYPGNSGSIGLCNPTLAGLRDSCTVSGLSLDPGECTILPVACHDDPSLPPATTTVAFIVDPTATASGVGLDDEGVQGGVGLLHDCNNWGFYNKQVDCQTCGTSVGPWDCDDADEPGGCGDCEVELHDVNMEVNGLLEEYWEDYPATISYRTSGGGAWVEAQWVWDEDGCTGGDQFYLESNGGTDDHYHLKLCDDLCAIMTSTVDWLAEFVCYDFNAQVQDSETFQASCPDAGTAVQWQYLGWNAVTPPGTNILLEVRAATTEAGLASAPWIDAREAPYGPDDIAADISDSGDSPACLVADPDDDCPFSLFDILGGPPESAYEFLEVRWTLNSSSDLNVTPTLYELEVLYTCPDSE